MGTVKEANEQIISDQDIIEAYKNCQIKGGLGCYNCPFDKDEDYSCLDDLREATFNLIQHQKAEIEKLKQENEFFRKTITENAQRALEVAVEEIETAKSEAINEFAERLKEKCYEDFQETYEMLSPYVTDDDIDNLVKEMTEVNENG